MICSHCGEASKNPWHMYKVEGGEVINRLFTPGHIPDGWYDSPKAAKAALEQPSKVTIEQPVKIKRKRRSRAEMAESRGELNVNSPADSQQSS